MPPSATPRRNSLNKIRRNYLMRLGECSVLAKLSFLPACLGMQLFRRLILNPASRSGCGGTQRKRHGKGTPPIHDGTVSVDVGIQWLWDIAVQHSRILNLFAAKYRTVCHRGLCTTGQGYLKVEPRGPLSLPSRSHHGT